MKHAQRLVPILVAVLHAVPVPWKPADLLAVAVAEAVAVAGALGLLIELFAATHLIGQASDEISVRVMAGHLPDGFRDRISDIVHHTDVGGQRPGSQGVEGISDYFQEGLRIPPVKLMRSGAMNRDVLALLLNNVRTPQEREGDLGSQIAACHTGAKRLEEICARYGLQRVQRAAAELLDYSEQMMRSFLSQAPPGTCRAGACAWTMLASTRPMSDPDSRLFSPEELDHS